MLVRPLHEDYPASRCTSGGVPQRMIQALHAGMSSRAWPVPLMVVVGRRQHRGRLSAGLPAIAGHAITQGPCSRLLTPQPRRGFASNRPDSTASRTPCHG